MNRKLLRSSYVAALLAVTLGSLSSCGKRHDIEFWSSFGSKYTGFLDSVVNRVKAEKGYDIGHVSKGSYDGIKTAVDSTMTTGHYPNIMTGYPDHFASYIGGGILEPLNDYVAKWDAEHPEVEGGLLADYYDEYMVENLDLEYVKNGTEIVKDAEGKPVKSISALPFNKSTELMGYNGTFVDYCATIYPELGTVPSTWNEWEVKGPKYREVLSSLVKHMNAAGEVLAKGSRLYFDQAEDGRASNFEAVKDGEQPKNSIEGKQVLDFTRVDINQTRVICWDSTDNMFITLMRQFGSQYTALPESEKEKLPRRRKGQVLFNAPENKQKTIDCLHFFNKMNHDKIFGVPSQLGSAYSSDGFLNNRVMFMLCSSGGLTYNVDWTRRFRVAPLPYFVDAEGKANKYVISQGANIAISNYGKGEEKSFLNESFDTIVELTRGENQARWCLNTGYFPCSKSATNHPLYQEFLADKSYSDPNLVAFREGSQVNQEHYMNEEEGWTKFVDPAFLSSSLVRDRVKTIFEKVFGEVILNDSYAVTSSMTYQKVLDLACDDLAKTQGLDIVR